MRAGSVESAAAEQKKVPPDHVLTGRYFSIHYVALKRAIYAR